MKRAVSLFVAFGMGTIWVACNREFRFDEPTVVADGGDGATARTCTENATCAPLGQLVCDRQTGRCVECLTDTECTSSAARHCDPETSRCVGCLDEAGCGTGQRCDRASHRCLDTCVDDDAPCPTAGDVCDERRRFCIECRTSANCTGSPRGSLCDPSLGRCVACISNAQCSSPAPFCDRNKGACVACISSASCPAGDACDPKTAACVTLK